MEDPPPADPPRRLTVADLLLLRRPTTGASSLHFPPASVPAPSAPSTSPPRKKSKIATAGASNPTSKPSTAPFAPISHPVLLAGTLSLPSAASPAACRNNCFSFSDPSTSSPAASVCCCLIDFDPAALGREIRVLAWNYLPSVRLHGAAGVLEVVRWCLAEEPAPAPKPAFLATIPLNCAAKKTVLATHGGVFGVVRSVSVVFSMPRVKAGGTSSSVGFLAELVCCGCRQCLVSLPEGDQGHNFETVKFLYFLESASTWRPVLACLVGKLLYITGLKKQMVSVGEKGSYTMLVSSTKTTMAWCPSYRGNVPSDCLPENCGGAYAGVITGIYLKGVVVELDDTVWLLIDDQQLPPPHSLRVGAVISLKNFRTISLKLSWTRIVLLATCSKTSVTIKSFSLVDSKIYMKVESKSLLGKFVDSLDMPARFWISLLISCFKQKFNKLFSDKEILGSLNKEGVVQAYAAKVLSSKCQPQQSLMMTFCRHNCGSSRVGLNLEACKLVTPLSSFICKCESLWTSLMLKFWNDSEGVGKKQGQSQFLCDGISYPGSITRIISSEDMNVVLAGNIKASPLSGRLQLGDSTGAIDIFIPDLPLNESLCGIYEIGNYKIVLEGPVAYLDHYVVGDPLSCKAVFQQLTYSKRVHHLHIYIVVCWRELNQIGPSSHIPLHVNNSPTSFHLLKLSHMFPANNIPRQNMSGPSLYAEAIVLPYDLQVFGQGGCIEHAEGFRMSYSRLIGNSEASTAKLCKIPCSLSFGSTNLCGTLMSSYSGSDVTVTNERILLDFKKGSFVKYPLLWIGGCYLLQCPSGNHIAPMESCGCLKGGKVSLNSDDKLWSLVITSGGSIGIKETIGNQLTGVISAKMDEPFSGNTIHDELKLVQPWNDFCLDSYFYLDFPCEAISKYTEEYNPLCHVLNGLCASSSEILSISSCIDIMTPKEASGSGSAKLQIEEVVQGDLISLQGKVENIHPHGCKEGRYMPGDEKYSICIHVTDNNHRVCIRGYLSKHSSLGIGPGAMVIFHRILLTKHELLLMPVTYIEVISIRHADLNDGRVMSSSSSNCLKHNSLSTAVPCLFSRLKHFTDNRCMQFHSRVATVLMLVLDSYLHDLQTPKLTNHGKGPKAKVRLAGFILDDGSSLCCCWADDTRAELMLRLQEVAHLNASVGLKLSKDGSSTNLQHTIGSCLEKMLKKHTSVIVRNYGIPPDFSCGDLEVSSVSGKVLGRLEEKLLKFITLNACWKGTLNVVASVLNPDDLNGFDVMVPDFYPVRNTQMLWINEVFQVDPLQEARRLYGDLVNC